MSNMLNRVCGFHILAYVLVLVGAANWGLVGIGGYIGYNLNVVNLLLGSWPMVEWAVYVLVGLSAVAMLFQASCTMCDDAHA